MGVEGWDWVMGGGGGGGGKHTDVKTTPQTTDMCCVSILPCELQPVTSL